MKMQNMDCCWGILLMFIEKKEILVSLRDFISAA